MKEGPRTLSRFRRDKLRETAYRDENLKEVTMRRASHTVKSPVSGSRRRYYRCRIRNRVRTWHCRALDFREVRGKTCRLPGRHIITLSEEFFSASAKATASSLAVKFYLSRVELLYRIVSKFCTIIFAYILSYRNLVS